MARLTAPLPTDAPFYTEAELDALYEQDPVAALRISREQAALSRRLDAARGSEPGAPLPMADDLKDILDEARAILRRDGGDIDLVEIADTVVRVRLKGACAGCPRSALDLRHVVERLIRQRFPRVSAVENVR
jgi:Fe-S cluster biogenesis protein NfuA